MLPAKTILPPPPHSSQQPRHPPPPLSTPAAYSSTCNHLRPAAYSSTCNHLRPAAYSSTCYHLRPAAYSSTCNHLRPKQLYIINTIHADAVNAPHRSPPLSLPSPDRYTIQAMISVSSTNPRSPNFLFSNMPPRCAVVKHQTHPLPPHGICNSINYHGTAKHPQSPRLIILYEPTSPFLSQASPPSPALPNAYTYSLSPWVIRFWRTFE